jgi:acetyl-CoA/propionyl-CoA carboxylase biotin carboxyl carrier protein
VLSARTHGHSVEARVYAESPARGFLPTSGRLLEVHEPSGEGVRVDSALLETLDVASDYDPLLAKVVAWAPDRGSAFARLRRALEETVILGVVTNVGFLGRLVADPDVLAGNFDTGLIEREIASLVATEPSIETFALYAMTWLSRLTPTGPVTDPWSAMRGWRGGGRDCPLTLRLIGDGGDVNVVHVSGTLDEAHVALNGGVGVVASLVERDGDEYLTVNGESRRAWYRIEEATTWVSVGGETWALLEEDVGARTRGAATSSNDVRSPMPGTVVSVRAKSGHEVSAGEALVIVSAMKMEHVLLAPRDGTVDILVREGDSVVVDEVVARLVPLSSTEVA